METGSCRHARVIDEVEWTSLVLALAWHDPPWKPWGIRAGFEDGTVMEITGGRGEYHQRIREAVANLLDKLSDEVRRELGIDKDSIDRIKESFNKTSEAFFKAFQQSPGHRAEKKHELQATLIPALLAAVMEASGGELAELAETVKRAGHMIRDHRVSQAETLASAMDRALLKTIANRLGKQDKHVKGGRPVFINPFNPDDEVDLTSIAKLEVEKIAMYIVSYAFAVARVVGNAKRDRLRVLRDVAVLLLEPVWYATVGEYYIPPADTRVPTHTVFDHLNASLATLNWTIKPRYDGPDGLLVVVDLAGVQDWIREARRLRDLWAASWLASLLAWKAVEGLEEEIGPGLLIQPPARLHPFLAAKLAGEAGDPQIVILKPGPGGIGTVRLPLSKVLGLALQWPVDPTVPATLIIATPPIGEGRVEECIKDGIKNAWRAVLRGTTASEEMKELLEEIAGNGNATFIRKDKGEADKFLKELEPPMMVKILTANIYNAYKEAEESINQKPSLAFRVGAGEAAKALYYPIALAMAFSRQACIKGAGRRTGPGYYRYALEANKRGWGKRLCTVCGRAPAFIDGSTISGALAGEIGDDRLCPYCAAKRLLRRGLLGGLDGLLVGKRVSSAARDRLTFGTVDAFTSRTFLGAEEVVKASEGLYSILKNPNSRSVLLERRELVSAFYAQNQTPAVPRGDQDWMGAVSIVIESLHDEKTRLELRQALDKLSKKGIATTASIINYIQALVRDYRDKFSIIMADGDFVGAIVQGRLSLPPKEYAERIFNVDGRMPMLKDELVRVYEELADTLQSVLSKFETDCGMDEEPHGENCRSAKEALRKREPSAIVTPSFAFTVSRALAVSAAIDRDIIERMKGMVVYAGGDDLLAILPPALFEESSGSRRIRLAALEAAKESRLAYWGANHNYKLRLPRAEGFNVLRLDAGNYKLGIAVAPALRAYGRSFVVLAVDSKNPLWFALEWLRSLEESKEESSREDVGGCEATPCKDLLFIASDAAGVAVLPWTIKPPSGAKVLPGQALKPGGGDLKAEEEVEAVDLLVRGTLGRERGGDDRLSPEALYEALSSGFSGLLMEVLKKGDSDLAWSLLAKLLERHSKGASPISGEILRLKAGFDPMWLLVRLGGAAAEAPAHPNPSPLPLALLAAARVARGWF